MSAVDPAPHGIPFAQALRVWARIALLSFGGPAGQIAVMHRILVEERRWIGEARFLHALNFCMLLPGPEAQQLATYIGWLLHRTRGGLVAGTLFVLPGVVSIMGLSLAYAAFGTLGAVAALFSGLKAGVLAVVLEAVARIGRRALRGPAMWAVAAASFLALLVKVPFPAVILAAGLLGYLGGRAGHPAFAGASGHGPGAAGLADRDSALGEALPPHARPGAGRQARLGAALLALWLGPVLGLVLLLGPDHVLSAIALLFSKMALVTFGGAYAVLAWLAEVAVDTYGWLRPGEMLDGLGLAETTPGPLIMVVQFVAFMAAFRQPGPLDPYLAGALGGLLATWVTFVPCFLWIFLGAPHAERLRGDRALSAALAAITAAVVGVILHLALWFGLHVLFREVRVVNWPWGLRLDVPVPGSLDPASLLLCALALVLVFRLKLGLAPTLLACAAGGLLRHLVAAG